MVRLKLLHNPFGPLLVLAGTTLAAEPNRPQAVDTRFPDQVIAVDQIAQPDEAEAISAGNVPSAASDYHEPTCGQGRGFVWDDDRPVLVTDIDNTISDRLLCLVPVTPIHKNPPLPGAVEVLQQLAHHYQIVYLTCRPPWLHNKTRAWLALHGFPQGPLFCLGLRLNQSQSTSKQLFLAELHTRHSHLAVGVGNTDGDARAYNSVNMKAFIIGPKKVAATVPHTAVQGWHELGMLLGDNVGAPTP